MLSTTDISAPAGSEPRSAGADTTVPRGPVRSLAYNAVGLVGAAALLYAVSTYSFSVFHGLVELFAASVALAIFFVTWHTRRLMDNQYVGIVGMAYFAVAVVGVLHTLAYKGTGIFPGASSDLATQLWLADRYLAATAFLVAPFFVRRNIDLRVAFAVSVAIASALVAAILGGVFPQAFVEGAGLTTFKVASEWAVIGVLAVAFVLLYRVRSTFEPQVAALLGASIVLSAGAEIAFTLYADPFGPANLSGHFLYAAAAYLVYRALVQVALEDPYSVLFSRLKRREQDLQRANGLSEGLTHIVEGVTSTLDFSTIMQRTVDLAADTASADAVTVSTLEDGEWYVRFLSGSLAIDAPRRLSAAEAHDLQDVVALGDVRFIERAAALSRAGSPAGEAGPRALMEVPLVLRDEALGVLSFHYSRPRVFSDVERNFARKLAVSVALAVENARLYEAEHEIAEILQAGLRPDLDSVAGIQTGCSYQSAPGLGKLGGDFFDVFAVDESRVAFMIGDVSGKGIKAATTTATVRGAVRALAYMDPEPVPVLRGLNETLERRGVDAGFVTLLYGTIDVLTGLTRLGIAGHPAPIICGRKDQPDLSAAIDPPLGLFPDRLYHSVELRLARGETLVCFTDGVIDARAEGAAPFGEEGVRETLAGPVPEALDELAAALAEAAVAHAGGRLLDDVAVLAVRFVGR
jgi:serine phosphatase RsbU (regulator of sigma subunit)